MEGLISHIKEGSWEAGTGVLSRHLERSLLDALTKFYWLVFLVCLSVTILIIRPGSANPADSRYHPSHSFLYSAFIIGF